MYFKMVKSGMPAEVVAALAQPAPDRSAARRDALLRFFRGTVTALAPQHEGLARLRRKIAAKLARVNGIEADPETDIVVTAGSAAASRSPSALITTLDSATTAPRPPQRPPTTSGFWTRCATISTGSRRYPRRRIRAARRLARPACGSTRAILAAKSACAR